MTLKAVVDSLDGVPEPLRAAYVERDGKFVLDAEGVEDVSGLKSALQKEREARSQLDKKLTRFKDIDPEKYAELLKEKEEFERTALEKKGDFDKLKDQLVEKHKGELGAVGEKLSAREKFIQKLVAENVAVDEITKAEGNVKLLKPHIMAQVRVVEEDGEFVAKVIDDKGNVRIANGKGDEMTIADLVTEFKSAEEYAAAFKGTGSSGTGSPPNGGSGKGKPAGQISRADPNAFLTNLDKIAKGEVKVTS